MVLQAVYTAVALFVFLVCSQLPLYGIKTNAGDAQAFGHCSCLCLSHSQRALAAFNRCMVRNGPLLGVAQAATPSTGRV
jgi:Plug domain of Sec61p